MSMLSGLYRRFVYDAGDDALYEQTYGNYTKSREVLHKIDQVLSTYHFSTGFLPGDLLVNETRFVAIFLDHSRRSPKYHPRFAFGIGTVGSSQKWKPFADLCEGEVFLLVKDKRLADVLSRLARDKNVDQAPFIRVPTCFSALEPA